jgi:hypothetical protein
MTKTAGMLEQIADNLVGAYSKKSGQSAEAVREAMRAETWYNPEAAIEFGLANERMEERANAFMIPSTFGFKHPPKPATQPKQRATNRLAILKRELDLTLARHAV